VTVYERDEAAGGLIRFGVPEFKIEKWLVERRVEQLAGEGVEFRLGVDVGVDVDLDELRSRHDAIVLATGSRVPRDLPVPGRELRGVHFAMEYLAERARVIAGTAGATISAAGKHVVVIGGGDTGADCVGHAHRERAASVTQIELLGEPPRSRPDDLTPWPAWPLKLRMSYALKEGGARDFSISTTRLEGRDGAVEQIVWQTNSGGPPFDLVPETEETRPADLVLLAMGFTGPEVPLLDGLGVERDARGNIDAPRFTTSHAGIFAAGDARRGQSLIVWAIDEGRRCAEVVRAWLDRPSVEPDAATFVSIVTSRGGE
jgi:glutamate synthase (NADPH/NADH) small chain